MVATPSATVIAAGVRSPFLSCPTSGPYGCQSDGRPSSNSAARVGVPQPKRWAAVVAHRDGAAGLTAAVRSGVVVVGAGEPPPQAVSAAPVSSPASVHAVRRIGTAPPPSLSRAIPPAPDAARDRSHPVARPPEGLSG